MRIVVVGAAGVGIGVCGTEALDGVPFLERMAAAGWAHGLEDRTPTPTGILRRR